VRGIAGQENAVVVRVVSQRWGEVPVVVTTRTIDLAAIRDAVRAELAPAAAPDRVLVVERMPLLASGKPDRISLQSLAQ
jgi:O-succinylbenzoic acid--CoA ligase